MLIAFHCTLGHFAQAPGIALNHFFPVLLRTGSLELVVKFFTSPLGFFFICYAVSYHGRSVAKLIILT